LGILFTQFKTLDFDALFDAAAHGAPGVDRGTLLLANSFVFIGAVGKSAQLPLHTWLPDAMAGPTTVSALIHAATMVKAGVYLVARSYPLFALTPELLIAIAVIGGLTAFFAATLALTNWDLKRVLAYSTLSQLGYMFLGLGVAGAIAYAHDDSHGAAITATALTGVTIAIFHLFSHAFFKAGLFLGAGSVGHAMHHAPNPYDMRVMGGLRKFMPATFFAMALGTLSIAGIPPFSGFFSKDSILHETFLVYSETGSLLYLGLYALGVITAAMTAYYMGRLLFLTFLGKHRGVAFLKARGVDTSQHLDADAFQDEGADHDEDPHHADAHDDHHHEPHEGNWTMQLPLYVLGTFALVGGIVALYFAGGAFGNFIHASEGTVEAAADVTGLEAAAIEAEHHNTHGLVAALIEPFGEITTYISIAAAIVGLALAWALWSPKNAESNIQMDHEVKGFTRLAFKRYHIDALYDKVFGAWVLKQADAQSRFDGEVIDGAVNGIAAFNFGTSERIRKWNTGFVQDYALTMLFGFILIVLVVIYWPQVPGWYDSVRDMVTGIILPGGL